MKVYNGRTCAGMHADVRCLLLSRIIITFFVVVTILVSVIVDVP